MMRSVLSLRVRLCPSWPGLAPPGFDFSRCSLRSVEGGFEDVREVFSGRCSRSTSSISSSLLRRSRSLRPMRAGNQRSACAARGVGNYKTVAESTWTTGLKVRSGGKLGAEAVHGTQEDRDRKREERAKAVDEGLNSGLNLTQARRRAARKLRISYSTVRRAQSS